MQRLSIEEGEWRIEPDPDGDFVRADEAVEEIKKLKAQYASLREAAMQAYGALVGSSASPESVQGLAKARLKTVLGFDRTQAAE
jgi:hypothetical protein